MDIDFRIGGDGAFYMPPPLDYVQVPPPQAYFDSINWHRTALHEIGTTSAVLLGKKLHCHGRGRFLCERGVERAIEFGWR
jgi:antirestriction protein ArdC